jgi:hypothetical protein
MRINFGEEGMSMLLEKQFLDHVPLLNFVSVRKLEGKE